MKKIIIIGGGIAGLSAGIYAQKNGFQTEIYEKNAIAGGQCIGWNRHGYHIDNCVHWLTGTKPGTQLYRLWEELGVLGDDIEVIDIDRFYGSLYEGTQVTWWKDIERLHQELLAIAPEDKKTIDKFVRDTKRCLNFDMPLKQPLEMMSKLDLIKYAFKHLPLFEVVRRYNNTTIGDLMTQFKSHHIQQALRVFQTEKFLAFPFLFSYATLISGNGMVPAGGSLAMMERVQERYKALGGVLYTKADVKKIQILDKKAIGIELASGEIKKGDYIISSTDYFHTFNTLIGHGYMDQSMQKAFDAPDDFLMISGFHIAFAIDADQCDFKDALYFNCEPLLVGKTMFYRIVTKEYSHQPTFYASGKNIIQVAFRQMADDYNFWKSLSKQDYKAEKARLTEEVQKRIIKQMPQLASSIEPIDSWTPITYERYCNAYQGSYMSFFKTKKFASAIKVAGRVANIDNLFLAGQWTQPPGGLPIAAASGKFAIQRILKAEGQNHLI